MPDARAPSPQSPASEPPLRRFWTSARGFWRGSTARLAWGLIALLVVITVIGMAFYQVTLIIEWWALRRHQKGSDQ